MTPNFPGTFPAPWSFLFHPLRVAEEPSCINEGDQKRVSTSVPHCPLLSICGLHLFPFVFGNMAGEAFQHLLHDFCVHLVGDERNHVGRDVATQTHQTLGGGDAVAVVDDGVGFAVDEVQRGFLRRVGG